MLSHFISFSQKGLPRERGCSSVTQHTYHEHGPEYYFRIENPKDNGNNKKMSMKHMSIIPALKRLRTEDHYLEANLGYTVRPCLKNQKQKKYI